MPSLEQRASNFILKASKIHSNKYDYSLVNYINATSKVIIICNKHGEFQQSPKNHIALKQGCPRCARNQKLTTSDFIQRARNIHSNKYDYTKSEYIKRSSKITIICPIHGEFQQRAGDHLNGSGCKKCSLISSAAEQALSTTEFIEKARKVHGKKYGYNAVDYTSNKCKVIINCDVHGYYEQQAGNHLAGMGCPKCAKDSLTITNDEFINRSSLVHANKYDYTRSKYVNSYSKVTIICPKHGSFEQRADLHLSGMGCSKCQSSISSYHKEIYEFVQNNCQYEIINNYRGKDVGDYEIDIWIPEIKFGIEIHGVYFHSANDDKNDKRLFKYHKAKADFADALGYKLIQIYDNEDTCIWKSVILNNLKSNIRIYARNTTSRKLQNSKIEKDFLEFNHISGYRSSTVAYGLFNGNDLLSCMSFIKIKNVWHIQRFATLRGHSVVGGASKLFAMFIKEYNPKDIITFANRRHGNGDVYQTLGFKNVGRTKPNYQYVNPSKNVTMTRHQCQKHKLSKLLDVFDSKLTESQNMFMNGYRRLWDAGNIKYIWCKHEKDSNRP